MISSIIQACVYKNSAQYEWARKEMTRNLWFAWRQNQAKVSLFTVYKAKKHFTEKEFLKENGEWRIKQKTKRRIF